jgi:hypothetical protein
MDYTIWPVGAPAELTAGDTAQWWRSLSDYPAGAGWTLHYRLLPLRGGTVIEITAGADGDDHIIEVSAETTAEWAAGDYRLVSYVTKTVGESVERHTITKSARLKVLPDPAELDASGDTRSHAEKMLEALEATLEGRATSAVLSREVDGVRLQYMTHEQLLKLRNKYLDLVSQERDRAAGRSTWPGTILIQPRDAR